MTRIVVLRMGHRIPRDWRLTTHVCLTARALGAESVIISDIEDKEIVAKVRDVADRFGGKFSVESGVPWRQVIQRWKQSGGIVVHLTAYGLPLSKVVDEIRAAGTNVLVVIGAEKVPGELFGLADWNVSVTNQPMSEVAALAVFLDWFQSHEEFERDFGNSKIRIVPSKNGKHVIGAESRAIMRQ
jgi:tRNA (cytidine56-2'-O)-methyltransferase